MLHWPFSESTFLIRGAWWESESAVYLFVIHLKTYIAIKTETFDLISDKWLSSEFK